MTAMIVENARHVESSLWETTIDIIQRHTGYARDDIAPEAEFEGDLGVDSIVLVSILADIGNAYDMRLQSTGRDLRTVDDLVQLVRAHLNNEGARRPMSPPGEVGDENDKDRAPISDAVIATLERHTGYPRRRLIEDARLSEDLGVDSAKLSNVLAETAAALDVPRVGVPSELITVGDLIAIFTEADARSAKRDAPQPPLAPQAHAAIAAPPQFRASHSADVAKMVAASGGSEVLPEKKGFESVEPPSFSAMGLREGAVESLRDSLRDERGVQEVVHLADCDTMEKPHAFLRASDANKVETFDETRERVVNTHNRFAAPNGDRRTMKDFIALPHRDLFHKAYEFNTFYRGKREEQLYWYGMPLESKCRNRAVIHDEITGKRREFLMFASNNYLGLANHPEVIDAIADAARRYGATNTGCRLIGGSNVLHKELERRLAKLKRTDDAIVYPSGYSANLGCISALAGHDDLIFTDAINHMSIQDGCKLSGASKKIYQHSIESLERTLERWADHPGGKLIVTDGVFSMHGDIVDLPKVVALARKYGVKVLVDDAHATGVLGKTGSGTSEHFGMKGEVDLELGTFSKTLSGVGGFVAAKGEVVEYLRFYSNSYVFAATIPASVAAGLIASIDVMQREPQRLEKLWSNIHRLRGLLLSAGFDLGQSASAIIPVVIGDETKTLEFGRLVRARGMFCQTVVYPGVALGDARLRISVTSEHTLEDLDLAAEILIDSAKDVGVRCEPQDAPPLSGATF
ncbi:aminotransferase class I/II-fold pyridoxal phosphate-dependent enzyme [Methylosinus sp. Sm6]|uniref:aminotransferase class I/II-fold pyridoxal phosphate-dependent enzyme n=1 Tax=Methylosinus sp. Sm6 TaxID=2866948 RepID=UPI001C999028|nr:aminotransferase class I/II-fold pyridoxal phosphate-dependent enzyme [Methylosinus sp. Sm6]MBY6243036.1 aminotransferase class I/II-fold pyridoxal phosphate-dependent enzyme [Methylosinus sp. Sm6]